MNHKFTQKMKGLCEKTVKDIGTHFQDEALEAHVFGSIAQGTHDALSDVDIWITFQDEQMEKALQHRIDSYATFGEIVLVHEQQHNFPLDGIQSAVIYKIEGELIRVDFYLCPLSSSRIAPESKILFEKQSIAFGNIISETKRTPRDLSDRVSFFISMCFNGIKKVVRSDRDFAAFLASEFKKFENEIPELARVPDEPSFDMLRKALEVLESVSDQKQKKAISEIRKFMTKVESLMAPYK